MNKKIYENRWMVMLIQIMSICFILITKLDLTLKLMMVFGYFMLFRQKRWHKHLLIMLLMTFILSFSSNEFQFNI
ncbi:hypothetical protein [Arcobacter sp. 15-2]|uniref:hypothetical protein n=1 Tax=Arcobacter sp. 15-2 TaxID=3374109 RepID=UPI00399D1FD1